MCCEGAARCTRAVLRRQAFGASARGTATLAGCPTAAAGLAPGCPDGGRGCGGRGTGAGWALGAAFALALFCARPQYLRFAVIGLVLVPTLGLVRSTGGNGSATAASVVSQSIESGSLLNKAAAQAGFPARRMTSGAGHDAMILAPRIPSAMLFLRSPGGLSHHPDETVLPQDVEAALATAMEFLAQLRDDRTNPKDGHA